MRRVVPDRRGPWRILQSGGCQVAGQELAARKLVGVECGDVARLEGVRVEVVERFGAGSRRGYEFEAPGLDRVAPELAVPGQLEAHALAARVTQLGDDFALGCWRAALERGREAAGYRNCE